MNNPIITENFLRYKGFTFGLISNEENIEALPLSAYKKGWIYDNGNFSIKIMFPDSDNQGSVVISDSGKKYKLIFYYDGWIYLDKLVMMCKLFDNEEMMNFCKELKKEIDF